MSTEQAIDLGQAHVEYTLRKNKRARRLRVTISCGGSLVVTAPLRLGDSVIERFLMSQAQWILEKIAILKKFPRALTHREARAQYREHKEVARHFVEARLAFLNQFYDVRYRRVSIRDQKTRWGSCSRRGNLSFNYRILSLSPELADYVIVHELCHLREFNHSRAFWHLVAQTIPDYQSRRQALTQAGLSLR